MIVRILFAVLMLGLQAASAQGWQDPRPGPVFASSDAPEALLVGDEIPLGPDVIARFGVHAAFGERFLTVYLLDGERGEVSSSVSLGRLQNRIGLYPVDVDGDGYAEILIEDMWEDVSHWSILASEPWGSTGAARRWHFTTLGREDDPATPTSVRGNLPSADAVTALAYGDQYLDEARGFDHRPCWMWLNGQPANAPVRALNACEGAGVAAVPVNRYHAFSIN